MPHSGIVALARPWTAGPGGDGVRSTAGPSFRCRRQPVPRPAVGPAGRTAEQRTTMSRMKWWGWGDEEIAFTHEDKPELGPFIERFIDVRVDHLASRPCGFADLAVPAPALAPDLRAALEAAVGAAHVSADDLDRVVHARGKSLRDLVRHRAGDLRRLPDVVIRPGSNAELQ